MRPVEDLPDAESVARAAAAGRGQMTVAGRGDDGQPGRFSDPIAEVEVLEVAVAREPLVEAESREDIAPPDRGPARQPVGPRGRVHGADHGLKTRSGHGAAAAGIEAEARDERQALEEGPVERRVIDHVERGPRDVRTGHGPKAEHLFDGVGFENGVVVEKSDEVNAGADGVETGVALPRSRGDGAANETQDGPAFALFYERRSRAGVHDDDLVGDAALDEEARPQPPQLLGPVLGRDDEGDPGLRAGARQCHSRPSVPAASAATAPRRGWRKAVMKALSSAVSTLR